MSGNVGGRGDYDAIIAQTKAIEAANSDRHDDHNEAMSRWENILNNLKAILLGTEIISNQEDLIDNIEE